jgi:hypothetical protein
MNKKLKPFSNEIQTCPNCGKLDVYLNDRHDCSEAIQQYRRESQDYYD